MNKYRVLKSYPKHITNSGRLITLVKGSFKYLKDEPQVIRLVRLGFLKQVIELPKKQKIEVKPLIKEVKEINIDNSPESKNKKNKG